MRFSNSYRILLDAMRRKPRFVDYCGGTRSGKTYAILQLLAIGYSRLDHRKLCSVVSETFPHLKRGAIRDFMDIMQRIGLWQESAWSKTDYIYTFPNGAQIEFFSADQPGKVHGPARDDLFINEAQNIPWETARQLFVRTKDRIIIDYNPTREFWSHLYIQPRDNCVHINSTYLDNEFLTPEQIQEIEANRNDTQWWRVYGLGETGVAEGVIYDFEQVDSLPERNDGMIETYGMDFGFTNDPTALVHCLTDTRKREIWLDEICYRKGMLNSAIADLLRSEGIGRNTPIYADCAEPKSIAELAQYGFNVRPCYKAVRKAEQIAHIRQYRMHITKRSVNGIREVRNYLWDKDRDGNPLNEPQKMNDHFCDAFRYGIYTAVSHFGGAGGVSFV